jgi:hypothetical protein
MRDLFESELEAQGLGSFADIKLGKFDSILAVPYWAWRDRLSDVTRWIAKASDSEEVKFSWPLIKDSLADCACVFSGASLEIAPVSAGSFSVWFLLENKAQNLYVRHHHK